MSHDEIKMLVSSFVDREVSQNEKNRIEDHIAGCHECKLFMEEIGQIKSGIRSMEEYVLDPGFASHLNRMTVLQDEESEKWMDVERLARNMAMAFTVIAMAFIAISFYNKGTSPTISEVLINGTESDSLTAQMLLSSDELSKNDLLYAAMTK